MRFIRGWHWWERAFGMLCGALAAYIWLDILLPEREAKQTGPSGSRPPHGRPGAKGGHQARRPVASYLDRIFPADPPSR